MKKKKWNEAWSFTKDNVDIQEGKNVLRENDFDMIDLPHTWNGLDGQDGGNDYYRGTCYYVKTLEETELSEDEDLYIEFEGANSSADLYCNGKKIGHHDGGYSTWRVMLTPNLREVNEIIVAVDNAPNDYVYPQMADFTFYGGLYRNVNLIWTEKTRFCLDYYGGYGVKVTPLVRGENASIDVVAMFEGLRGDETVSFVIYSREGEQLVQYSAENASERTQAILELENVHLWNGRKDPYLYSVQILLKRGKQLVDERTVRFGCRTFSIDAEEGFILNGKSYPLRGVSRHQDRPEIGNALKPEHHEEDIECICDMGANTVRLAHYQHDQYFYDLCDEKGLIVWAEIPYISKHLSNGCENTILQMKELIVQNYHHPCIVVWGLSNEITMSGTDDIEMMENHRILNDLCHKLDKTRLTTIAVVSMCSMDTEYLRIPDAISYNHYFGWYGGDTSMNGKFMDEFHAKYPSIPIGMSEYGCEALNWHSSRPEQGDYTEEYQAYYHEELIKQLYTRPYIWATYVWNMFDFAADARAEGGEDGMNHKGLMTFDRKYKKDAFYAYKAWLSEEPFVHICGKRYVNREEDVTRITVYSNLPEVSLFVNGEFVQTLSSEEHFFYFFVKNEGESRLTAKAGSYSDESLIRKVDVFDENYRMKESGDVLNWFEITAPEGYFSINDKLGELMESPRARLYLNRLLLKYIKEDGKRTDEKKQSAGFDIDPKKNPDMLKMLSGFTLKRMFSMLGTAGLDVKISKEDMLEINRHLNGIKKKKQG